MSLVNRSSNGLFSVSAFTASLVVGIIAAFLRITAAVTVGDSFLWVTLGVAVAFLGILLIFPDKRCCCTSLTALLIGILGTVLFAVILLAFDFVATSIFGAIAVGLLLFFFSLTLTQSAVYIRCFSGCDNG